MVTVGRPPVSASYLLLLLTLQVSGRLQWQASCRRNSSPNFRSKTSGRPGSRVQAFPCMSEQAPVFEDMFARMDTDCSGGISFNEWVAAIATCREEGTLHKRRMMNFARLVCMSFSMSPRMHGCLFACTYRNMLCCIVLCPLLIYTVPIFLLCSVVYCESLNCTALFCTVM